MSLENRVSYQYTNHTEYRLCTEGNCVNAQRRRTLCGLELISRSDVAMGAQVVSELVVKNDPEYLCKACVWG